MFRLADFVREDYHQVVVFLKTAGESLTILILTCLNLATSGLSAPIEVQGHHSEAINFALAQAREKDTVFLPAGTYSLAEPIHPGSGVRLLGAGQDRTILCHAGAEPSALIDLSDVTDVEVADLTLDGQFNPRVTQGITSGRASKLFIHRVTIRNLAPTTGFGPHGILFAGINPSREGGVMDSEISDCVMESIGVGAPFGCGIRLSWGSSRNRVLRNRIANTGRGGIFGDNGSTDLVIRSNTVSGSGGEGLGIEVWGGCDGAVIEDNHIDHWLSIGGCNRAAVRRNVISDGLDEHKFCGIEGIGSDLIVSDNQVVGGQKIGLSVSDRQSKSRVLWAYNKVSGCSQWGAQFQGEEGGISLHYLYRCEFTDMPLGLGQVWYPGDEGHGFRFNGNCQNMTFEECLFTRNGRAGIQVVGQDVNHLRFLRCHIRDNQGPALLGQPGQDVVWQDCDFDENAANALPGSMNGHNAHLWAKLKVSDPFRTGQEVTFSDVSESSEAGIACRLWDLGDGPPATGQEVRWTYRTPGIFRITLVVWDQDGNASRAEETITIKP